MKRETPGIMRSGPFLYRMNNSPAPKRGADAADRSSKMRKNHLDPLCRYQSDGAGDFYKYNFSWESIRFFISPLTQNLSCTSSVLEHT
jgi:hypothetical protein